MACPMPPMPGDVTATGAGLVGRTGTLELRPNADFLDLVDVAGNVLNFSVLPVPYDISYTLEPPVEVTVSLSATEMVTEGEPVSYEITFATADGRAPSGPVSVILSTQESAGGAISGVDYTAVSATITVQPEDFTDGEASVASDDQILMEFPAAEVVAVSDMIDEPDEVFVLRLSAPVADPTTTDIAVLGTPSEATIVIEGPLDVALPEVTVTADAATVREGETAGFTLSRTNPRVRQTLPELTVNVTRGADGRSDQHDPGDAATDQCDLRGRQCDRNRSPSRPSQTSHGLADQRVRHGDGHGRARRCRGRIAGLCAGTRGQCHGDGHRSGHGVTLTDVPDISTCALYGDNHL